MQDFFFSIRDMSDVCGMRSAAGTPTSQLTCNLEHRFRGVSLGNDTHVLCCCTQFVSERVHKSIESAESCVTAHAVVGFVTGPGAVSSKTTTLDPTSALSKMLMTVCVTANTQLPGHTLVWRIQ